MDDLDILTKPIKARTKEWIDKKISQLKQQGIALTYGELEDEPASEIESGKVVSPIEEASQSPPITRSRKRKEMVERQPKP